MRRLILPVFLTGILLAGGVIILAGCSKEGPAGANGTNGTNGLDANQTCKLCHAKAIVDEKATEFEMSKHSWGTTAFSEAGNAGCSPCHTQEGFKYVCENNIAPTFTFDAGSGKYVNNYTSVDANDAGLFSCFTCHSQLHTTYGYSDITTFTGNLAPVAMTMWGGAKTINLTQDGGKSNLCVHCHQPRPLTAGTNSRLFPYDTLKIVPNMVFWDTTAGFVAPFVKPSYRMHNHYGVVGAVFAGMGAIEFTGSLPYTNSAHTTHASCENCHMATLYGRAGGHSFNMRNSYETALGSGTTWNFNGCNTAASSTESCHSGTPLSATSGLFPTTRANVKLLLDALATKINALGGGHDLLHREPDPTANLWAGIATNNYDGYLDIYSSSTNPNGYWRDPATNSPTNNAKPKFPSFTNKYMGAIINFQFCLREYSLGIHNTQYVTALLTNTAAMLP